MAHVALAVLGVGVRLLGAPPLLAVDAAAPPYGSGSYPTSSSSTHSNSLEETIG